MSVKSAPPDDKKKRVRSPNFPAIDLEEAVKRAKEFYDHEDRHWANVEVASRQWGYNSASSGGAVVVAALVAFGLLEDEGTRNDRKVRLTDVGLKILLDNRPNSQERTTLLQKAAIRPRIYAELWEKFNGTLPSDQNIEYLLLSEMGFNRKSVARFIEDFRHTLTFAGLLNSAKLAAPSEADDLIFKVGDYVQWESQDTIQFEAKKITGISADYSHAFVEGSATGLPVNQLTKVDPPAEKEKGGATVNTVGNTGKRTVLPKEGMNSYICTLDSGDVVLQWPKAISEEDYELLETWLETMKKKVKRSVEDGNAGSVEKGE